MSPKSVQMTRLIVIWIESLSQYVKVSIDGADNLISRDFIFILFLNLQKIYIKYTNVCKILNLYHFTFVKKADYAGI